MMTKDEALELAIETLENVQGNYGDYWTETITDLREALAQPEQEPDLAEAFRTELDKLSQRNYELRMKNARLKAQLAQGPVASIYITPGGEREFDDWCHALPFGRNLLFTSPPQREWVGLTHAELVEIYNRKNDWDTTNSWEYEQVIEAKLKEKNT